MKCKKCIDQYAKLKKELAKYRKLSLKDPLTNLWNERKLKEDLKRYSEIQGRSRVNFIVALFDVDNFKQYNDKYGHEYGNKVLKRIAKVLTHSIRRYENVYRLGSGADEFVVIFSHSNSSQMVIRRIIKKLKEINFPCSVGINNLEKSVLKKCDRKMYENKRHEHKHM